MSRDQFDALVEDLRGEETRLKTELSDLAARQKELESQLSRIGGAVAALTGKAPKRRSGKKKSSRSGDASSTKASSGGKSSPVVSRSPGSPDPARVAALAAEVLSSAGSLPEAELERRVRSRLGEEGQSAEGLADTLRSVLSEARFTLGLRGWTMQEHTIPAVVRQPELEATV